MPRPDPGLRNPVDKGHYLAAVNSASGVFRVSFALKGLNIIAQGKRSATLGRVDKTKPNLTLKGLHKEDVISGGVSPFFQENPRP